jgi:hypothetical protein
VSFADEYVYIRMNHLESRLKAFFDHGCRYEPSIETPLPAWRRPPILSEAVVVNFDRGASILTVKQRGNGREIDVRLCLGTRITLDHAVSSPDVLRRGDRVTIHCADKSDSDFADSVRARHVQIARSDEAQRLGQPTIWMSGRVSEVNRQQRVVTVERVEAEAGELKGFTFWQQAGGEATAYDPDVAARIEVVSSWVTAEGQGLQYHLAIDDGVAIFVNGRAADLAELKPGDYVGVLCRCFREGQERLYPEQIRAYRY